MKEEINKIVCHCDYCAKNFDSTLLTFVHIFDGFLSFIVYHLKRRKRKVLKKLLVKFPRHVYVDIKKRKKTTWLTLSSYGPIVAIRKNCYIAVIARGFL